MKGGAALASLVMLLALGGCGTTAPNAQPDATGTQATAGGRAPHTPASAFEQAQRDKALAATRQVQWGEAALAWELLTVLRPDSAEYRGRLAETRVRIDRLVAERLPRAALAAQRGEIESATQQYLAILALQPDHAVAADALRALERERNRRNYLGKYSRHTLTRRALADAEMPAMRSAGRPDVEHAALLANDGEYDDAIALLERQIVIARRDVAVQRLLASVYRRKAESMLPRDRAGAIAALEKSVRLHPAEPTAAERLRQLRGAVPAAPAAPPTPTPTPTTATAPAR